MHSKNLSFFRQNRGEQYNVAIRIISLMFDFNHIGTCSIKEQLSVIFAEYKWGKREVMEIISLMLSPRPIGNFNFYYFNVGSSKNDMKPQTKELSSLYGIIPLCTTRSEIDKQLAFLKQKATENPDSINIIFYDESDLGDGKRQIFADYVKPLLSNYHNVCKIDISATPWTSIDALTKKGKDNCIIIGNCAPTYVHLTDFLLSAHIVTEPFVCESGRLTSTGRTDIKKWLTQEFNRLNGAKHPTKSVFIARSSYANSKKNDFLKVLQTDLDIISREVFGKALPEAFVVDQHTSKNFPWMRGSKWENGLRLILVNQTFTRGTETDYQEYVFETYDYRETNANTSGQALGRNCNYRGVKDIRFGISQQTYDQIKDYGNIMDDLRNGNSWSYIINKYDIYYNLAQRLIIDINKPTHKNTYEYRFVPYAPIIINGPSSRLDKSTKNPARVIEGIDQGRHTDGRMVNTPIGESIYVCINDIDEILTNNSSTDFVANPQLRKTLRDIQGKYNLPSAGLCILQGVKIAKPVVQTNSTDNSSAHV